MFAKGDLVYVPQDATLYGMGQNNASIFITPKPNLALFLNYDNDHMAKIVMNGKHWLIKSKEIYLNQGE